MSDDMGLTPDWRENLERAIHSKGIKVTKLSTDLGMHRDYVANVLKGKAHPKFGFLVKLFNATGIDIMSVLNNSDDEVLEVTPGTPLDDRLKHVVAALVDTEILETHRQQTKVHQPAASKRADVKLSSLKVARNENVPMSVIIHDILARNAPKGYILLGGLPNANDFYSNITDDWSIIYVREKLAENDPVLKFMNYNRGYISWARLKQQADDTTVFERSAEYGRVDGSVITRSYRGKKVAVSLCHEEGREDLDPEQIREVEKALDALLRLMAPVEPEQSNLDFLYHISIGHSTAELKSIYGVSDRKISDIKKSAIAEMSASSLEHAISVGIDTGLL